MKKKLFLALLTTLLLLVAASAALADSPSNYICTYCDVPCTRWVPVNSEGRSYHMPCCDLCENLWLEDLDRLLCTPIEGSATCTTPAVCSVCGFVDYYGSEPDPNAHDISDFYYTGPETHYRYCLNGCYTTFDEGPHTGGAATCADYPICTVCNAAYGNPDPNNHDWGSWSSLGNGTHIRTCASNPRHTETANCSGGTANCTDKAVCQACAAPYGEIDPDAHDWGKWMDYNGKDHIRHCKRDQSHSEIKPHSGGTPTCTEEAVCEVCGGGYRDANNHGNHTFSDWMPADNGLQHWRTCQGCKNEVAALHAFDNDADMICDGCGYDRTPHTHSGGTATCTEQAVCTGCGQPYGEVDPDAHAWGSWGWLSAGTHIRVCLACYAAEEEAPHYGGDGSCMPTCEDCNYQYYDETSTKHNTMSSWVYWDYAQHYRWCMGCGENYVEYDSHYGGDGSCKPVCEGCGVQYRNVNGQHNNMSDWAPFDDTQHFRVCNDCASRESEEYSEHSGGMATCTDKAICEGCGLAYGTRSNVHPWGEWQPFDGSDHIRYCTNPYCTSSDYAPHTGGDGSCTPVCEGCGYQYDDVTSTKHNTMSAWAYWDSAQHYRYCLDCGRDSSYEYKDHSGGDGSCLPIICEGCGERYEDPDGQHRNMCDWVISDSSQHRRWCLDCNDYESMEFEDHYGGTATCTAEAICEGCGTAYGTRSDVHPWGEWRPFSSAGHMRDCTNPDCRSYEYAVHTGGDGSCSPQCEDCGDFYIDAEGQHRNMSPWLSFNDEQHMRECLDCGGTKTEYGAHTGGTATCTEDGVCEVCDAAYIPAIEHAWGEWKPNGNDTHTRICGNDPTHTETADCTGGTATCIQKAICTVCGGEHGKALGHAYGDWKPNGNDTHTRICKNDASHTETANCSGGTATCTQKAICTVCGGEHGKVLGHAYGDWKPNGDDTHTRVCGNDASHTETAICSGGTATCTQKAVCTVCGGEHGDVLGHAYSEWKPNDDDTHTRVCGNDPTHTETANCTGGTATCTQKAVCTVCGGEHGKVLGHAYGDWKPNGDDTHTRACANDASHAETEDCTGGKATCTEDGVCEVCDAAYIPAIKHSWGEWKPDGNDTHNRTCANDASHAETAICSGGTATCTEKAICTVCGGEHGKALGHAYGDWKPNGDGTHTRTCLNDASHTETDDCTGGKATCTEDGVCEVCDGAYIPAIKHSWSERKSNGDGTHTRICANDATHTETGDCTWGDWSFLNDTHHERRCTVCNGQDVENHTGGTATCAVARTCDVCEGHYGAPDPDNHSMELDEVIPVTCIDPGLERYLCQNEGCPDPVLEIVTEPFGQHLYNHWDILGDNMHYTDCALCGEYTDVGCMLWGVYDGEILLTVCPVCGEFGEMLFEVLFARDDVAVPIGTLLVRGLEAPFEGALYGITVAGVYGGEVVNIHGEVTITLPIELEGFSLVRVDVVDGVETRTEIPFTLEDGQLTFTTVAAGLFLLVPIE